MMTYCLLVVLIFGVTSFAASIEKKEETNCEIIQRPAADTCSTMEAGFGYNYTRFPNFFDHRSQEDAEREMLPFKPLIKVNCHKHLSLLLCSLYFPMCTPGLDIQVPPCRSLCLNVKSGCEPLMRRFGYSWPFNCTELTPPPNETLCVRPLEVTKKNVETAEPNPQKPKKRKGWTVLEEHESVEINCRKNKTVLIRKAKHINSSCCPSASMAVLTAICNGQSSCSFTNNESSLGGHCKGRVGQLSLRYKCVRDQKEKPCP